MDIFNVQARVETITTNTRLTDRKYGGWLAVNIGTAPCTVLGFTLNPSEGLDMRDVVPAGGHWTTPIDITVQPGGSIRLLRLITEPVKGISGCKK